jgi:hypothetical protein
MQMEVFGAADTTDMDNWDWGTTTIEMFPNQITNLPEMISTIALVVSLILLDFEGSSLELWKQ